MFSIINNTPLKHTDQLINNTLQLKIHFSFSESYLDLLNKSSIGGLVINEWVNKSENDLVLMYNDSALLGLPVLLHSFANFYAHLDNSSFINTTLSTLPKINQSDYKAFDANSFVSLIILGIGYVLPVVSFISEVVQEKNVSYLI